MRYRFDNRPQLTTVSIFVSLMVFASPRADAVEPARDAGVQPQASDDVAFNAIFGEPVLGQNAQHIVFIARDLPPEQCNRYLSRWVLPNEGHGCRIDGIIQRSPQHDVNVAAAGETSIADYPESQWILCPARELVQLNRQLGRLDALREQVLQLSTSRDDGLCRTTLLTLIDIAANARDRVADQLALRFTGARDANDANAVQQWWSDLIVLWAAMENPQMADLVIEDYFGAFQLAFYQPDPRLDVIADYLCLLYRARANSPRRFNAQHTLSTAMFDVFSRIDANTHARGNPLPRFHFSDQGAVKLSGHESDMLALRSPLVGSFEAIGEFATHAGAFTELVAAGVAARPTPNLDQVSISGFAKASWQQAITPSIQPVGASTRARAKSDAGRTIHYWNSREIYVDTADEPTAPWVAARSWRRTHSAISEFAIAGSPSIPQEINLVGGPSLRGWASFYHPESNSGLGHWTASIDDHNQWMLVSSLSGDTRGCFDENLLSYVRPLAWDATVSYEFEYLPGNCEVHPCLGRSVFLIRPDGIWLHRLTDGRFEPSELRADNAVPISADVPGAKDRSHLKTGWNQAELRIAADRVSLWLNGHRSATLLIEPGDSRTFGFFHYRDQTEARLRKVHLTGDWPRDLPAWREQPLASTKVASLDAASDKLAASWCHDFRHGVPPRFFFSDGDAGLVEQLPDGVRIHRLSSTPAFHLNFIGRIRGNFDIVLEFKDLNISDKKPTWHSGVGLAVSFDNAQRDRIDVVRRKDRLNSHQHIVLAQNHVNRFGGVDWLKDTTHIDESLAGRLRIVRQDDVIHGLYADGDSKSFRSLGDVVIEPGAITRQGLRLHTVTGKDMPVAVTLKGLTVRADAIDLPVEVAPGTLEIIKPIEPAPQPTRSMPGRFFESVRGWLP